MIPVKKFMSLFTAAALVAVIAGCGGSNGDGGNGGNASGADKQAKISIFQSKVEIAESLEALAQKYTEETGNEVEIGRASCRERV